MKQSAYNSGRTGGGIFVVGQDDISLHFSEQLLAQGGPSQVGPYSSRHKILVVGDGDLTFSLSLASALGGAKLVATTYDSIRELEEKYSGVASTIEALKSIGVTVLHEIDATKLNECPSLDGMKFHRIVFNFPHIGGATQKDVELNQELLKGFFKQSLPKLNSSGECHVALRRTLFYDSWDVVAQAQTVGMELKRVEDFKGDYLSYENQRTSGEGQMRQAPSIEKAKRYIFVKATIGAAARGAPVYRETNREKTGSTIGSNIKRRKDTGAMPKRKRAKRRKMPRFGSAAV